MQMMNEAGPMRARTLLVVTARPTGQQTTCTVSVNGTVKDTKSSTGAGENSMVQCSTMGNP